MKKGATWVLALVGLAVSALSIAQLKAEPTPPLACPAGGFTPTVLANGDVSIVYDQFPAPNDNSYGVNAVGWGTKGHKFQDLTGSDKAGVQVRNPNGTVVLSFTVDYLSASTGTPSGYRSLGPFGGDGSVLTGTLTPADLTFDTSLAQNLNGRGYFTGGTQTVGTGVANLLVNSPPTLDTTSNYTLTPAAMAAFPNGWEFHDTYFVTLSASKLVALGAEDATTHQLNPGWVIEPNLTALHNSPAKACPSGGGTGGCTLSLDTGPLAKRVDKKELQITIKNTSLTTDAFLTELSLSWPAVNGKLTQVKLDGDIVYDTPDIAGTSTTLNLAQLVADAHKRKFDKNKNTVLKLVFQNNASADLTKYNGSLKTDTNCNLVFIGQGGGGGPEE